jgi:hypothetical protein
VDIHTRRKKQQALMTELIERKIRLHAQHLYDKRGQGEGLALQDWVQAESEVLSNSILAPLYRRSRPEDLTNESENGNEAGFVSAEASASEAGA